MLESFHVGLKGNTAYVYVWISVEKRIIYVGETRKERNGVLGRAYEHVSEEGTLRKRVYEHGYYLEEIDDFILLSFPLPTDTLYPNYILSDKDRKAVEHLVQKNIDREIKDRMAKDFFPVSYTNAGLKAQTKRVNICVAEGIVKKCLDVIEKKIAGF